MGKAINVTELKAEYEALRSDRTEYEAEWKQVSEWLLPARGLYQIYTKPRKKKLTLVKVINTAARESLRVLTSGLQAGLTSPSRPWSMLAWEDDQLGEVKPLVSWLEGSKKRLDKGFAKSNLYQVMHSFYTELAGFGTACLYCGEDGVSDSSPFRFEVLTAGEYAYTVTSDGRLDRFFRTLFFTARQLADKFGSDKFPQSILDDASIGQKSVQYYTVVQTIIPEPFQDKPLSSVYFLLSAPTGVNIGDHEVTSKPIKVSGFYEMPFFVGRWELIGQDTYGLGAGSESLANIKRLQEMEKAFLIATHKSINPPLNAPATLRGKVTTLPGGINYYTNKENVVSSMYDVALNFDGITVGIQRVEEAIGKIFYNDIFLTSSRDPNASPLRTGEVNVRQAESMMRLGPVIERIQHEVLRPLIERAFNIMLRKGLFEQIDQSLADMAGDYSITMISPLAQQQKLGEATSIERYLQAASMVAQFDPSAMDNVNSDGVMEEFADIFGPPSGTTRDAAERKALREARQKQAEEKAAKEDAQANQEATSADKLTQSQAAKNFSDAGVNLGEMTQGGMMQ